MSRRSEFRVIPFTNPSGAVVFRVTGKLDGLRIRENYTTQEEAERVRLDYVRQAGGIQSDHKPVITWLSAAQVREAEAAYQLLDGRSIVRAAQLMAEHEPGPARSRPLAPLYKAFLVEKARRAPATRENLKSRLDLFFQQSKALTIRDLTLKRCGEWIFAEHLGGRSSVNRRAALGNFIRWLARKPRRLVPADLLEELPEIVLDSEDPRRLFTPQVKALMKAAEEVVGVERKTGRRVRMLHNYALRTFAGLRPSEVLALAQEPEKINLREGYVYVDGRTVKLEPNAVAWLTYCAQVAPEIVFKARVHERVKKAAKVVKIWQPDICRHTYGSNHLRRYNDIGRTVEAMGNSERVVRRYYAVPMTDEERQAFDDLLPPGWRWRRGKAGRVASPP